jgi:hypothetical protein
MEELVAKGICWAGGDRKLIAQESEPLLFARRLVL